MKKLFPLIISLFLFSCAEKSAETQAEKPLRSEQIKYAQGFEIEYFRDYKKIIIKNPWKKGETQQILYFVENNNVITPKNGLKIVVPITKIAVGSTTYYGFLELLDEINSVKGACTPQLAYNQTIAQKYKNREIVDLGDGFSPNLEKIMMLQPQIMMLPSYNQQDETVKRLVNANVSVVYNNEWTENSPLARTEWLKFIAAFYDKGQQANNIFSEIEKRYFEAKKIAESVQQKPTIIVGGNFKGTWYMPGGQSYMAQLFADAGGDYFFKNDSATTSLPMSFEHILKNFHKADIWLNCPAETLDKLFAMDERHKLFKAAQNGNVFAFLKRYRASGANDFWESGIANPDIVLKDIIWALHPDLLPDYQPFYIIKCDNFKLKIVDFFIKLFQQINK